MNATVGSLSTILVPLDGSALAERALPVAERLACALDAALLLVRVIPVSTWAVIPPGAKGAADVYQAHIDAEDAEARAYLERVARDLRAGGRAVQTLALRGDPVTTILGIEPRARVDLVVMATHGRTGLRRFALGSVADGVVRRGVVPGGRAPVLLVRPFSDILDGTPEHAVVPLDGSPLAEQALDIVRRLRDAAPRRITLIRVVDSEAPADRADEAACYLGAVGRQLAADLGRPASSVDTVVNIGNPADEIIRSSGRPGSLIIMATHGRAGPSRWALGSVADQVLRSAVVPLLLVRPPDDAEQMSRGDSTAMETREVPRVLVVDEDPAFRHLVVLALSESGRDVAGADTVDEATAVLRQCGHPMVVLLDRHRIGVLAAAANDRRLAGRHVYIYVCVDEDSVDAICNPAFAALSILVLRRPFDTVKLVETVEAAARMLPHATAAHGLGR